ncbi:RNA-binding protein 44 [Liasis olivaceus]
MNAHRLEVQEKPGIIIHIPSGEKAVVKSHHPSSSFEKNIFNKVAIKVIASDNYPETGIMEGRECRVEKDTDTSPILNISQEPAHFQKDELDNTCCDLQTGAKYSISSQSCYLSASHLNLSKENLTYFSSSLNEGLKYVHKQQHNISSTVENTNGTDTNTDFSYIKENESECNCFDDDSQLEYHSAEEQDYDDCDCSYRQETQNSEIFQEKELVNEDVTDHQQPLTKFEDKFSTSSCVKGHYNCNEISTFLQMFQDVSCTENQYIHLNEKRNENLSMFYSIIEDSSHIKVNKENNSKLFLTSKAEIEEKIKVNFLSDTTLKSIMPTTKEIFKKNDYLNKTGSPHMLCQERMLLPFPQVSHNPEGSNSCAYKPSVVVNADIENSVYNSWEHLGNCTENFSGAELKCIRNTCESGKNFRSAVNQAIDATADFRASFTTSRAINVKSSVVSKAQNTVITMMSKCRPREWLTPEIMPVMTDCRSVACNTDWSCISGNVEMIDSQIATSDMLEDCITSDATKHGWKLNPEDPLEWSNSTSKDLNEIPYRMMQLSKEINRLPNCCKEMLQRAIKAEMQLLKLRYQMFHQHCWQTCRIFMKGNENISSSPLGTGKSVSEILLSQDSEVPSLHLITAQKNKNSDLQQCLSKKNLEERKNSLEEENLCVQSSILCNSQEGQRSSLLTAEDSLNTQEISEDWFDAAENPTTIESSVLCTDPLKRSATETQTIEEKKKEFKNNYCVHVGGLSPSVSEVDLWLHFRKYNVSEVSVCEYFKNYRYAFLNFKTACDAKLAVKEMNEREIKGKAMKVRLVRTVRENGIQDYQNCMKQECENQRLLSQKRNEYRKNSDPILEVPAITSATFILPPDDSFSLKKSDVSKDDLKSPLPLLPLANVPRPTSGSSEGPLCASGLSKVPHSGIVSSKSSSRKTSFEEDITEGLLPFGSVQFTPNPSSTFIPPNTLNLRSFRKVVQKLEELYPEISRDNILDALVEIKEKKGQLSGLSLSAIVQMTSSLLNKKFTSQSDKK